MSVALTRSRCINALRCYVGYALDRIGSVLFLSHFTFHHSPLFVSVEPAAVCQLRCPECPVGMRSKNPKSEITNRKSQMSNAIWQRTLAEVSRTAWTIQFYFQGEPLLNSALPQMIADAHAQGLYTIVSTNAQAMTAELAEALVRSGLDRIIVSMDGLSDQSYGAYRIGGSLSQTKAAIRYLREAKTKFQISNCKFQIEIQCLRLRSNEHEWAELRRTYRSLGADRLTLKTAQLYDYTHGHPLMPSNPRYSRYAKGPDGLFHRKPISPGCFRVWSGCVVTTTGEVLPCCYDKAHAHAYGNIMNASMREIFASAEADAFRRMALRHRADICQECWK